MTLPLRIAAGLLIVSINTHAQSLDSLIREAYRNNPQLKALAHQADAARYRASAVGAMPAPSLGVEFSQVPTSSANIVNEAISNNFSLSQMFMLGGKLSTMSAMEEKKGSLLEHTHASLLVKLRAAVKMNYVQLWRLDRQIEIQERTIALIDELARSLASRVQTNRSRSADLLTVQAEAASERARLADLAAKRRGIRNVLVSLTAPQSSYDKVTTPMNMGESRLGSAGMPAMQMAPGSAGMPAMQMAPGTTSPQPGRSAIGVVEVPAITADSILPALPPNLSEAELRDMLLSSNPALQSMEHMKEMNDLEITSAKKELIPDLMLQAMVMRMPNGMILTSGQRSAEMIKMSAEGMPTQGTEWMYSIMASITLPFAPWSSARSSAKADELQSMNLSVEAEKHGMQREMLSSLRSALTTYETQDTLARMYQEEILPLTHDAAQAQTVAYQTGQGTLQTVLDAYRMELMKTDDYLMTVMNRHMAFIEIEMMVGLPLQ